MLYKRGVQLCTKVAILVVGVRSHVNNFVGMGVCTYLGDAGLLEYMK